MKINKYFKSVFYKENLSWIGLVILITMFLFSATSFQNKEWKGDVLQCLGLVIGIYLTLMLFFKSNKSSDAQFREQIEHLQRLNNDQIAALQKANQEQISKLQELNNKQVLTTEKSTEDQINAYSNSINEQILSFEKNIRHVSNRLVDNSELLAELLSRELEKEIFKLNDKMKNEQKAYGRLMNWKPLRTREEKQQQLKNCNTRFEEIKNLFKALVEKYHDVQEFLNNGYSEIGNRISKK